LGRRRSDRREFIIEVIIVCVIFIIVIGVGCIVVVIGIASVCIFIVIVWRIHNGRRRRSSVSRY
jgi:hypothetical protein